MQIMYTWVVTVGKRIEILYETINGWHFVTSETGLEQITAEKAQDLKNNSKFAK